MGIVGILVSLATLIYLAYRGWNVIFIAPLCAAIALLFSWGELPILGTYTQIFMPALGAYLTKFFPLFLLGAVFGKLMDDSGSARVIAQSIVKFVGAEQAVLAIVLACGILTYGGVSLFVVAFSVYPIAAQMFRKFAIPKRLVPAAIALGSFTFTMTALPGTPSIQNAIPIPFFGTTSFAAPGLGIIAGIFMLVAGLLWLHWRVRNARAAGEGYGTHKEEIMVAEDRNLPGLTIALLPLVLVLALNATFTYWVLPAMDHYYLATAKFKNATLKDVLGIWSIIAAMAIAIAFTVTANAKRINNLTDTIGKGAIGSLLPMANTASEVGYGAVIASLGAFVIVRDWLKSVVTDPVVSIFVVVNVLAGMTGSASGGLALALGAMGQYYADLAAAAHISPQIMHRVATLASGGMDILPHNGAVITLLAICGLTHRESYFDMFVVASLGTTVAGLLVIVLNAMFGTF